MRNYGINKFIEIIQFLLLGLVVLNCIGWFFSPNDIIWFGLEFQLFSLVTAVSLLLCSAALACIQRSAQLLRYHVIKRRLAIALAILAMLSFLATVLQPSSPLLLNHPWLAATVAVFPSKLTAMLLLLSAIAVFCAVRTYSKWNYAVQIIALVILLTSIMTLSGHINYAAQAHHNAVNSEVSLITAIALLFFSLALFFSNPDSAISGYLLDQSIGASAQRFILPSVIIVPIAAFLLALFLENMGIVAHENQGVVAMMLIIVAFVFGVWLLRNFIDNVETQFEITANEAPVMIWMASSDGHATYFNRQWLEFTGRNMEDELGIKFEQCVHSDDVENAYHIYRKAFASQNSFALEYRLLRRDGQYRWILEKANPYRGLNGEFRGFIGSCTDITEHRQASEKMQLVAHVFENSEQGIIVTDADQRVLMTNPAFSVLTGYSQDEVVGQPPYFLQQDKDFYQEVQLSLQQNLSWQGEIWNRRKNGELFLEELSVKAVLDNNGTPLNYIGVITDITQRKQNEEHYMHLAHYDPLTDLPNRALLTDRIGQSLFRAKRYNNKVALLFLDLNKFKAVNDDMGHHVGDLLLKEVAKRITACIRQEDTVSRLGGDEFVILLSGVSGRKNVVTITEKIIALLSMPYHIEQFCFSNFPSIGIALYPEDGLEMKVLLENADKAMYQVKHSDSLEYAFFQGKTIVEKQGSTIEVTR